MSVLVLCHADTKWDRAIYIFVKNKGAGVARENPLTISRSDTCKEKRAGEGRRHRWSQAPVQHSENFSQSDMKFLSQRLLLEYNLLTIIGN